MDKSQMDHLNMMETVDQFFIENPALCSGNAKINLAVTSNHNSIAAINQLSPVQLNTTTGIVITKKEAKDSMADLAFAAASAGKAYAHEINNSALLTAMSVTITDIKHAADNTADDIAQNIYAKLLPIAADPAAAPDLAEYGATTASLGTLQTAITTFSGFLGQAQQQAAVSTTATSTLAQYFADAMDLLKNRLDPLMVQFKTSMPKSYNEYDESRAVQNIGHRKTVIIKGFVYNNQTPAQPQPHVFITLTGTDSAGNAVNLSKHTDANGHYSFTRLHIGSYTVTPSLSGFTVPPKTSSVTEAQVINNDFVLLPA